jgi:hypothetical protein
MSNFAASIRRPGAKPLSFLASFVRLKPHADPEELKEDLFNKLLSPGTE